MTGARPERQLVEQHQPRLAGQRPPEREHLLLASRQQPGATIGELGERREVVVGDVGVEPLARVAEPEVLGDGEAEEDAASLGHVGDAEPGPGGRRAARRGRRRRGGSCRPTGARGPRSPAASWSCPAPFGPSRATTSPAPTCEVEVAQHRARRRSRRSARRAASTGSAFTIASPASESGGIASVGGRARGRPSTTCGFCADLCRRAAGDHRAELEHDELVADPEHEPHVVVDEQDRGARGRRPRAAGGRTRPTRGRRGRRPARRGSSSFGSRRQGSGDGDELALALGELARQARRRARRARTARALRRPRRRRPTGSDEQLLDRRPAPTGGGRRP